MNDETRAMKGMRRVVRDVRGQVLTEYVLLAALLVTVAIAFNGILPSGLRYFLRGLAYNVRTIAP